MKRENIGSNIEPRSWTRPVLKKGEIAVETTMGGAKNTDNGANKSS